jgi:hypothetical protein
MIDQELRNWDSLNEILRIRERANVSSAKPIKANPKVQEPKFSIFQKDMFKEMATNMDLILENNGNENNIKNAGRYYNDIESSNDSFYDNFMTNLIKENKKIEKLAKYSEIKSKISADLHENKSKNDLAICNNINQGNLSNNNIKMKRSSKNIIDNIKQSPLVFISPKVDPSQIIINKISHNKSEKRASNDFREDEKIYIESPKYKGLPRKNTGEKEKLTLGGVSLNSYMQNNNNNNQMINNLSLLSPKKSKKTMGISYYTETDKLPILEKSKEEEIFVTEKTYEKSLKLNQKPPRQKNKKPFCCLPFL